MLRLKGSLKTMYSFYPAYSLPQNILCKRNRSWVSLSPIEKTEEAVLVLVESRDTARGHQILSALGAWTENLKIMGMAHILHFTNQETITEAPSLVISSERAGVEPRTPTMGCSLQSSRSLRRHYLHYTRGLHSGAERHQDQALAWKKQSGCSYFLALFHFMQFRTQVI